MNYLHNITGLPKHKIRDILIQRAKVNLQYIAIIMKRLQKQFRTELPKNHSPPTPSKEREVDNNEIRRKIHLNIEKLINQLNK